MSGRISKHSAFLYSCLKNRELIEGVSASEIEILVEIIFNLLNNKKYFLTPPENLCLKPIIPLLIAISKTRSCAIARELLCDLSSRHLKTIVNSSLELIGHEAQS